MLLLRDLLAPPVCLSCRAPGADLCGACRRALPWLRGERCRRCGLPGCAGRGSGGARGSGGVGAASGGSSGRAGGGRSGAGRGGRPRGCPAAGQAFEAAWAPVAYAGPVPALVAGLKQRRARVAAEPMVAALARAPAWLLGPAPLLVPVPTAASRARSRGFDQAAVLAAGLAARGTGELLACLERTGAASRQRGSGRTERLTAQLEVASRALPDAATASPAGQADAGAHHAPRDGEGAPRTCVLVDDVHTTGATFHACALALRAAGAHRVVALAYARTL